MSKATQGHLWEDEPDYRDDSLAKARRIVQEGRSSGVACPVCEKWCKQYRRAIHSEVALFLVELVATHATTLDWTHAREILPGSPKASTDAAYLVHWGMVRKKDDNDDGKRGGYYKPTERGVAFVHGLERVPRWVDLYNNRPVAWAAERIDISTAIGKPFDYAELTSPNDPTTSRRN